jgi:hypothetical protein
LTEFSTDVPNDFLNYLQYFFGESCKDVSVLELALQSLQPRSLGQPHFIRLLAI